MKKFLLVFLAFGFIITSCKKNDNEIIEEIAEDPKEDPVVKLVADYPVQNFMWDFMNFIYFWQADVPDLADTRFSDFEGEEYVNFLASESNPSDFFFKLCYNHENIVGENAAIDRFSRVTENYEDLLQSFAGVSKSDGVEFGLVAYGDERSIFGFVRYIVPGSDADGKEIKRGDIFVGINGNDLTRDNYIDLLFGDLDTYTMNFGTLTNNTISPSGRELSLTKQEGLIESPILVNKVIEQNGLKIGYLMYNSFLANFDEDLNNALGDLKVAGINELILDLRYNGGGRVSSAIQLASSIYGTKTDEVFAKERFNNKRQAEWATEFNFTDKTLEGSVINELNLSRLYVITSRNTASASELIINGLEPHIDVVQIGETTVGKNEFSFTFVDDPDSPFLYAGSENNVNPNNKWAITPLCGRIENADGFSDYTSGLQPDRELVEDIANMGTLGSPSTEPLLGLAISDITGTSGKSNYEPIYPIELLSSSLEFKPLNNIMFMGGLKENNDLKKAFSTKLK
ncbi:MAG: S41 family peptidase [Maribacter sp.]